jgi:hypothetical protein
MSLQVRVCASFLVLTGCAAGPASLSLDTAPTITAYERSEISLPSVRLMDGEGNPFTGKAPIAWSVQPPDIAVLTDGGLALLPKAEGQATVTATAGTLSQSFDIKVVFPDELAITDGDTKRTITLGERAELEARVIDDAAGAVPVEIAWSSSDPGVALVDNGVVSAVTAGSATINATWGDLSDSVEIEIHSPALVENAPIPSEDDAPMEVIE